MAESTRPEPFAQTPPPLRTAPEFPERRSGILRHRAPTRAFEVTIGGEVCRRHEGAGLTLDQVVDVELAQWPGLDPGMGAAFDEDMVVWERTRARAVIHARPDGSPSVTWIDDDGPTARPSRPEDSYPTDEDLARSEASAPAEGTPGPAGDDEGGDDPPAPPGPRAARALRMPPRPLLRTSLTVAPPWDPDPVTLEVVVLADDGPEGDGRWETARTSDLPELEEGGWVGQGVFGLQVYMRVKA